MGYMCDFCGRQRSVVHCRSDAACLCLSCDQHVHAANTLSQRHSRTLLCEKCNSQPAFLRCVEERTSLCQNCDWAYHGVSASEHRRQNINCYTGCPSTDDFSTLWPFILEIPSMNETTCEHELGLMHISKHSFEECLPPPVINSGKDVSTSVEPDDGRNVESEACLSSFQRSAAGTVDQPCGSSRTLIPELCFTEANDPGLCKVDAMFVDFNIDELDLNIENYEEIFGLPLDRSEQPLQNGDIDGLFRRQHDLKADGISQAAPSTCPAASANEGQAVKNTAQPASSNAASVDSIMSSKTEPVPCFPTSQAHSGLSLSGLTGESSTGDFQDCVVSPMLLMSEHAWCSPCSETSLVRSTAVMRYKEKKAARKFDKRVRYASRKARADVRKRVKGRFVKAGEAYDYDPLAQTRSY